MNLTKQDFVPCVVIKLHGKICLCYTPEVAGKQKNNSQGYD